MTIIKLKKQHHSFIFFSLITFTLFLIEYKISKNIYSWINVVIQIVAVIAISELCRIYRTDFATNKNKEIFFYKSLSDSLRVLEKHIQNSIKNSEESTIHIINEITKIQHINLSLHNEAEKSISHTHNLSKTMQNLSAQSQAALHDFAQQQAALSQLQAKKEAQISEAMNEVEKLITPLVDVIRSISQQTQLLSFNAAIEAAHAGPEGSGFKIIATAVRELARQTSEAAKQIADSIQSVQKAAHANSVNYTQEITATLSGMQVMHDLLASNVEHGDTLIPFMRELSHRMDAGTSDIRQRVVTVLTAMQYQDVLRQLLEQVSDGLHTLSDYSRQPSSVDLVALQQRWKDSYVSMEQRIAHEAALHDGEAPSPSPKDGPKIELF